MLIWLNKNRPRRNENVVWWSERPLAPENELIFTHIPKCGGTSLHQLIASRIQGRYEVLTGESEPSMVAPCGSGGHQFFRDNPYHGHRPAVYVTMLRRPQDRFISFYRHQLGVGLTDLSLDAFASKCFEEKNPETWNLQTRMLAGSRYAAGEPNVNNKRISLNYSIVGLLEQPQPFLRQLAILLGAETDLSLPRDNCAEVEEPQCSPATAELIAAMSKDDLATYAHFKRLQRQADVTPVYQRHPADAVVINEAVSQIG